MAEKLVVIGGDAAGMSAASQARRRRGRDDLEIVVFEKGVYTSYSACGIPYLVGGVVDDLEELVSRTPETFRDKQQIDVRMRHEVTAIDLEAKSVRYRDLASRNEGAEAFDQLLIATGGKPLRPDLEGMDAEGIFGLQTLGDGEAVVSYLAERQPKRAVVVGGSYIGMEMAEGLRARGLGVALVEMAEQPLVPLDPDMGEAVADAMRAEGIEVFVREPVEGFRSAQGRVTHVVTARRELEADLVILGLGRGPNVDLAQHAGIEIGPSGGIVVDPRMHTSSEGIWAAGDCAEKFHLVSRERVAIGLGTHANKEGRTAGINIGGDYATFPGVLGTAVTRICSVEVGRTGLNEREAARAGLAYLPVTVDSTTRAGYFPGARPIRTKMIVERDSGRLLGAQIIGKEGAAKRIDVIATALWNRMTVQEMLNMDLSYSPSFSPVWDPVLITARKAWQQVEESSTVTA